MCNKIRCKWLRGCGLARHVVMVWRHVIVTSFCHVLSAPWLAATNSAGSWIFWCLHGNA